ncbi:UNVERIFIED_CONTAM: hypothetical protein GTU68_051548 [Idotea baltica]|nr:hypothetical protein [Idotea baltica]
MGRQRTFYI